jgi:hypothetical protein
MQSLNRYMGVLQEACNLNFKIKTFHLPHKEKKSIMNHHNSQNYPPIIKKKIYNPSPKLSRFAK